MKSFVVFALFVAAALAAPPAYNGDDRLAEITNFENDNIGVGPFRVGYQTSNGISAQAEGQLTNAGQETEAVVIRGSYSYTGPDGVQYTVEYTADENGFHPVGAHIPQ